MSKVEGRLCGGLGLFRLKAVQVVDGALRECCGLEDCAGVVLENLKPCGDVGGVVLLDLRRGFEVGAKERGAFRPSASISSSCARPSHTSRTVIVPFSSMDSFESESGSALAGCAYATLQC